MMTANKKLKELADKVATMLESGNTSAWTQPWKSGGNMPMNALTGKQYHGINMLSLWVEAEIKGFRTHQWVTFRQKNTLSEKEECEISVIKGQKGTTCYRWVTWIPKQYKKIGEDQYLDQKTGAIGNEMIATRFALKTFAVFNLDQLEGVPDHYFQSKDQPPPTHEAHDQATYFVDCLGADIRVGGDRAFYNPRQDFIGVPAISSFFTEDAYWSTMFHELTHWTGHESRLNRPSHKQWGDNTYAAEELVAEFGAAFMCAELGFIEPPTAKHEDYLASWATQIRKDPDVLMRAARGAEKAVAYMNKQYQATLESDKVAANS